MKLHTHVHNHKSYILTKGHDSIVHFELASIPQLVERLTSNHLGESISGVVGLNPRQVTILVECFRKTTDMVWLVISLKYYGRDLKNKNWIIFLCNVAKTDKYGSALVMLKLNLADFKQTISMNNLFHPFEQHEFVSFWKMLIIIVILCQSGQSVNILSISNKFSKETENHL